MRLARVNSSIRFTRLVDHPFFVGILRRQTSDLDTIQYFDQALNDWVTTALLHPIPISEHGQILIRLHGQQPMALDRLSDTMERAFGNQQAPIVAAHTSTVSAAASGSIDWKHGLGRKTSDDDPHLRRRQLFESRMQKDHFPTNLSPSSEAHGHPKQSAESPLPDTPTLKGKRRAPSPPTAQPLAKRRVMGREDSAPARRRFTGLDSDSDDEDPALPPSSSALPPSSARTPSWYQEETVRNVLNGLEQMEHLLRQDPHLSRKTAFERVFPGRSWVSETWRRQDLVRRGMTQTEYKYWYNEQGARKWNDAYTEIFPRVKPGVKKRKTIDAAARISSANTAHPSRMTQEEIVDADRLEKEKEAKTEVKEEQVEVKTEVKAEQVEVKTEGTLEAVNGNEATGTSSACPAAPTNLLPIIDLSDSDSETAAPRASASSSTHTMAPMQPIPFIDLSDSNSDEVTPAPAPAPRTVTAALRWETKADGTQVFLVDSDSD
jgi:hypothetical protein